MSLALASAVLLTLAHAPSRAQGQPIRLSVNNWKIEAGDAYTMSWTERGGVQTYSDYTLEEASDPQFKDKANLVTYIVRAHHKKLENTPSFSHGVRYYRIRAKAWIRSEMSNDQVSEEVFSNVVRVTLLGTNNALAPPSFPDDPETQADKKKKKDKDSEKKEEDDYPTMGRADFTIVKVAMDPPTVQVGQPFTIRVTVRNQGVVPSPPVRVRVSSEGGTYTTDIDTLKPRFSVDGRVGPLHVDKAGPLNVQVTIDPDEKVPESRKDNNTMSRTFEILPATAQPSPSPSPASSPSPAPSGAPSGH